MTTTAKEAQVQIKGTSHGLVISLPEGDFEAVLAQLDERLRTMASFIEGGRVAAATGAQALTLAEIEALGQLLNAHQVSLWALLSDEPATRALAASLGLVTALPAAAEPAAARNGQHTPSSASATDAIDAPAAPVEGQPALKMRGTLRSGQSIEHVGAVIVLGDVNAGAHIAAGGDVVIWGRLRGTVHAGALGDETAVVCALMLQPTQLRIGALIGRAPDPTGSRWRISLRQAKPAPEVARIEAGAIVVEPWDSVKNW